MDENDSEKNKLIESILDRWGRPYTKIDLKNKLANVCIKIYVQKCIKKNVPKDLLKIKVSFFYIC